MIHKIAPEFDISGKLTTVLAFSFQILNHLDAASINSILTGVLTSISIPYMAFKAHNEWLTRKKNLKNDKDSIS